jgi:hypothetical protein
VKRSSYTKQIELFEILSFCHFAFTTFSLPQMTGVCDEQMNSFVRKHSQYLCVEDDE